MVARVNTVAFQGVEVRPVDVQVQIANGLPAFTIVGLVKPIAYKFCLFAFLTLLVTGCNESNVLESSNSVSIKLMRVIDGDTFIGSDRRIRLWGIDAPEKDHPSSYAATLYLTTLLEAGEIECEQIDIDRYERDVMKCFVDGDDIARSLVRFGMATDYKKYSKGYYGFEEGIARKNNSGLWKFKNGEAI